MDGSYNFISLVRDISAVVALSGMGVILMSIVINLQTKERTVEESEKKTLTSKVSEVCYATTGNWEKKEQEKKERAEHNARVLRQYKIKG